MKRGKWFFLFAAVLLVVGFVFGGLLTTESTEYRPEDAIFQTLAALSITDAEMQTETTLEKPEYTVYTSESTGFVLYFDSLSGDLQKIIHQCMLIPGYEFADSSQLQTVTDAERRALVIDFAEKCISANQVGELEIVKETVTEYDCLYEIAEKENNSETGTKISISCGLDGTIFTCVPQVMKIETQQFGGTSIQANEPDWISENDAIGIGREALESYLEDNELDRKILDDAAVCETTVRRDRYCYKVTFTVVDNVTNDTGNWEYTYYAYVDAYTGETSIMGTR